VIIYLTKYSTYCIELYKLATIYIFRMRHLVRCVWNPIPILFLFSNSLGPYSLFSLFYRKKFRLDNIRDQIGIFAMMYWLCNTYSKTKNNSSLLLAYFYTATKIFCNNHSLISFSNLCQYTFPYFIFLFMLIYFIPPLLGCVIVNNIMQNVVYFYSFCF